MKPLPAIKALHAIRTQIKRKNFWLLGLIAALATAIIFLLFGINADMSELAKDNAYYNARLSEQVIQASKIATIQIDFGAQIQEWKDVLLRGHDTGLYQKHWAQFEQNEAAVHQQLSALHRDLLAHETQPAAEQTSQLTKAQLLTHYQLGLQKLERQSVASLHLSDQVAVLIDAHQLIGNIYREALLRHPLSASSNNIFLIDQEVRGVDRWLSGQLVTLREQSYTNHTQFIAQAQREYLLDTQKLHEKIQRGIVEIALILIANLVLLISRLSASAQQLASLSRQSEASIFELAYSDGLTGLPNRRLFTDKLDAAIALSGNTSNYGGLIFLDLDNFKTLNDTKGHAQGDLLLVEVAQRLKHCVRASDTVARLGGDEFVVVLGSLSSDEKTAGEQADSIAEKISLALAQPYTLANHAHHGSASIGVALFNRGEISSEEVLKRADTAMYQAKRAGRNTVCFYDQQAQTSYESRSQIEQSLHTALGKQQFVLHYQIQVDHQQNAIGAEALLRWQHPDLGLLYPSEFIALAEGNDLIIPIGGWVLETACTQLKKWEQMERTRDLVLSVNISAVQLRKSQQVRQHSHNSTSKLRKPSLVEQVQTVLERSQINPARLKLEITESLALHDLDHVAETLLHLKSLGVSIALDDFGTGHSSLSHLKRIPLDQIKIDQSFVQEIVSDSYDQAIVKSMVDMAHSMNIQVIAEGVETVAQQDALIAQGCVFFQGNLFGAAIPVAEFEQRLMTNA